jgi:hypothetical protein
MENNSLFFNHEHTGRLTLKKWKELYQLNARLIRTQIDRLPRASWGSDLHHNLEKRLEQWSTLKNKLFF